MKNFVLLITAVTISLTGIAQSPGGVSSGLAIWLKADAGTSSTTNGDFLSSWNDQSGNAVNATQTDPTQVACPRFVTDAMNGNPAIEFNGGAKYFNINLSSIGSTYTIITVAKRADSGSLRYVVGVQSTVPRGLHIGYTSNTTLRMSEGAATSNADATVAGYDASTEVPVILKGEAYGSMAGRAIDEVKNGTTTSASNALLATGPGKTAGVIGRGFSTQGFAGYVSEVIMYNRTLSSTEIANIYTYISVKYGLTIDVAQHNYYDDATYSFDLFGLGKNTATQGLNQTASSSESADAMVSFSNATSLDNGDYLVAGNNNGALSFAAYGGSNCAITNLLSRVWKAEETGETGSVDITFDLTSLTGLDPEDVILMVDYDGDGYDDETPIEGTYSAPYMTFSGINLTDNSYFTLAEGVAHWYSRSSGNTTDAIWAKTPTGTPQAISVLCSKINITVQAGHSITNDALITAKNFTIEGTASFNQDATNMTIYGTYMNNGTHLVSTGNVNFNGSVSQTITGVSTTEFYNVNCNNAVGVSIAGIGMNVKGVLQVNSGTFSTNGKLRLKSYSTMTGSIGPLTSGDILGNVTIERYHSAAAAGWVNICSPIQNKTVSDWNDDLITTGFTGSDYPSYAFNNIQYYDETALGNRNQGYVGVVSAAEALINKAGYFVYANAGVIELDVDGAIFKGSQTLPVTFTNTGDITADGWCLVANPYPSAIDWDSGSWTKTNMNNSVQIWNSAIGQYASYVNGVGTNGGTGIIPSSQSFFVQANAASPVLTATESVKTSTSGTYKSLVTEGITTINLSLGGMTDQTVLVWDEESSSAFENDRDGFKLRSQLPEAPYLCSVSGDGYDLSISDLALLDHEFIIPIKIESALGGKATISWKGIPTDDEYELVFEDVLIHKSIPMADVNTYIAEIKANRSDARFQLHWKKKEVSPEALAQSGTISGVLTSEGIQLTFNFPSENEFKITTYNMLGQQLTETFYGRFAQNTISFSDNVYGAHSLVDIINLTTGERTTIRLGK
ncbi:MAG: hypothetical protein R2809_02195 [Flavobacteriales bacterium]